MSRAPSPVPPRGDTSRSSVADSAAQAASFDVWSWRVLAAQAGDEDAFRTLYRTVQPQLLHYLRTDRRRRRGRGVGDVASETWLQTARDLRSFRGDFDDFRGWTVTIARHRALDHVRRLQRRPRTVVPLDEQSGGTTADAAAQATESLATQRAIALIARLPRVEAEVVMLRVVWDSTPPRSAGSSASDPVRYAQRPTGACAAWPNNSGKTQLLSGQITMNVMLRTSHALGKL